MWPCQVDTPFRPHHSHSPTHPSMFLEYLVCCRLIPRKTLCLETSPQLCPPLPVTMT